MADAVEPLAPEDALPRQAALLGSWSGRGVSIGQVDDALLNLRRNESRAATRISTINLVVVADDSAGAERARHAMRRLGGRNPGRIVVIIPAPHAPPNVDADVHLHEAKVDTLRVWWEEVLIMVGGPVCDHLDSLVEPLTLGDLPLTVWFPSSIPDPSRPLVGAADVVMVESPAESPGESASEVFARLADLAQRRPLVDLSWIRLTPWRRLLASLFDGGEFRAFAGAIDRAEVAARPCSGRLLTGWLMDRLELPPSSVTWRSAGDAAIELSGSIGSRAGRFEVMREDGDGVLTAMAEIEEGPRRRDGVRLPKYALAASLAEALTLLRHDPIYERAIGAALDSDR